MPEFTEFPIPRKDVADTTEGQKTAIRAALGITPANLGVAASDITDATATGQAVITAADAQDARESIGAHDADNLTTGKLDADLFPSEIPALVSVRRGTEAELDQIVLNDGELAIVDDAGGNPFGLRAGDGSASGGLPVGGDFIRFGELIDATFNSETLANAYTLPRGIPIGSAKLKLSLNFNSTTGTGTKIKLLNVVGIGVAVINSLGSTPETTEHITFSGVAPEFTFTTDANSGVSYIVQIELFHQFGTAQSPAVIQIASAGEVDENLLLETLDGELYIY